MLRHGQPPPLGAGKGGYPPRAEGRQRRGRAPRGAEGARRGAGPAPNPAPLPRGRAAFPEVISSGAKAGSERRGRGEGRPPSSTAARFWRLKGAPAGVGACRKAA